MQNGCLMVLFILSVNSAGAGEWPQFRGPDGQGHANPADVPLNWSETENIKWKTPIPGEGYSSPVIMGNQIWITSATENGLSLRAVCVDRTSGAVLHDVEVFRPQEAGNKHGLNGYASPTPVLDNEHVYVHFGGKGTACLSRRGEILWRNNELKFAGVQGSASSPVLHDDLLILNCDGNDVQFVAALDKKTGDVRWKQPRKHYGSKAEENTLFKMAYSTPLVATIDGVDQLVSTAADHVAGYDVQTGTEIWWMQYEGCSQVARPSYGHDLLFVVGTAKLDDHRIYVIRPGRGQLEADSVVWQRSQGVGHVPSPLLVGNELYFVKDDGIATCVDALTGKEHWRERLGGKFRASPVEVQGRVYFCSEEGKTTVLAAGKEFRVLAVNELDGVIMASPAVADDSIVLRTGTHLYWIE